MRETDNLDRIIRRHLIMAMIRAALFVCLLVLVFTCVFGVRIIEINDMYPAVCPGDIVLFYRLGELKRSDVVVTRDGAVGRISAMEPDTIGSAESGEITINGYSIPVDQDKGIFFETHEVDGGIRYPVKIDKGEYFILGDKRDTAKDSRVFGALRREEIAGRVFMVLRRRMI